MNSNHKLLYYTLVALEIQLNVNYKFIIGVCHAKSPGISHAKMARVSSQIGPAVCHANMVLGFVMPTWSWSLSCQNDTVVG